MKQAQRDRVMKKFRDGVVDNLVATDVAARGIDVDDMEAVFNYDFPQDEDYYVHRIGRTGRAGKSGKAFSLCGSQDLFRLRSVKRSTKSNIQRIDPPSAADVERKRDEIFFEKVKHEITEGHLGKYVSRIERMMGDEYTSMDVAAALLKLATGGDELEKDKAPTRDFGETGASPGMVRLFINVGRQNGVGVRDIIGAIAGETGVAGKLIGSIDLYDRFTFVEVPKDQAAEILHIMKTVRIKGNDINIEPAQKKDGEPRERKRGGREGGREGKRFRKRGRFEG
jgi:ATP-dependent RNA helicase DeaD